MRNKPSVSVSEATPEMIKAFLGEGWDGKIPDSGMVELPATIRVTPQEYQEHKEEIDDSAAMHGAEIVISEDTSCPCCKAMGQEVMPDGSIRQLPVVRDMPRREPSVQVPKLPTGAVRKQTVHKSRAKRRK